MVSHVYSGTQKSAEYEDDINLSRRLCFPQF